MIGAAQARDDGKGYRTRIRFQFIDDIAAAAQRAFRLYRERDILVE